MDMGMCNTNMDVEIRLFPTKRIPFPDVCLAFVGEPLILRHTHTHTWCQASPAKSKPTSCTWRGWWAPPCSQVGITNGSSRPCCSPTVAVYFPPTSFISFIYIKKHLWKLISTKNNPLAFLWTNTYGNLPKSNYVSYLHVHVTFSQMRKWFSDI